LLCIKSKIQTWQLLLATSGTTRATCTWFEKTKQEYFSYKIDNLYSKDEAYLTKIYPLRLKKNDVLGFKICPKKNDVLLNLACVHVHVDMQQSINT
jgi:hypothetical protein